MVKAFQEEALAKRGCPLYSGDFCSLKIAALARQRPWVQIPTFSIPASRHCRRWRDVCVYETRKQRRKKFLLCFLCFQRKSGRDSHRAHYVPFYTNLAYCSPACRSESSRKRGMDRSGFSNTATFTFWLKPLKGKLLFVFRERFRGSGSSRERVLCMFSAHPLFRGSASSRKRAGLRTRGLHHAKVAIFSEQRLPLIYRPDPIISSNNFLIFLLFIRFIFFLSQNP